MQQHEYDPRVLKLAEDLEIPVRYISTDQMEVENIRESLGYYHPGKHSITLAPETAKSVGINPDVVFLHELCHALGHPKFLNRTAIAASVQLIQSRRDNPFYFGVNTEQLLNIRDHYVMHEEVVANRFAIFMGEKFGYPKADLDAFENSMNDGPLKYTTQAVEFANQEAQQAVNFVIKNILQKTA